MLQIPIDELRIAPGYAVEWTIAFPTHGGATGPGRPRRRASYIQDKHFAVARHMEQEGITCPSYLGGSFEIRGRLDRAALEAALLNLVRRHEVLRWVFQGAAEGLDVSVLDPEEVKLDAVDAGPVATSAEARDYVHRFLQGTDTLRGPWLVMGAMIGEEATTLYFACDHLVSDGVSTAVVVDDVATAYEAFSAGRPVDLPETGGYGEFAALERRRGRALGPDDSRLDHWKGFVERNGAVFPRFPLDLGVEPGVLHPVVNEARTLLDERGADALEARCRAAGSEPTAGILAAVAVSQAKEGGPEVYRGLLPVSRRNRVAHARSMGWYVNTLPVEFSVAGGGDFGEVVSRVRAALLAMLRNVNVPFDRAVEVMTEQGAEPRSWPYPVNFFSYLDFRRTPGGASHVARKACGHVWGSHSDGIFFWFYRNHSGLHVNTAFPDTPRARTTTGGYLRTLERTLETAARDGAL
ncbi:condensation domain-containing protein [Nocardiopsis tropica]|uniref:Condensation domain-containing protein n=1 Tax=Nocardiopsis tropica TaxID=109330 RepID=A0ABU7KSX4_9ACTN|nr:condensation domain-containing protein [Nocardiopsis umidischolae]MEE2052177.1 condensation domain-containing protein [Nocardiopsis umidischolae]